VRRRARQTARAAAARSRLSARVYMAAPERRNPKRTHLVGVLDICQQRKGEERLRHLSARVLPAPTVLAHAAAVGAQ
jgi:hypothetical protein